MDKEAAFPFLCLPGEVRNIIYRHALVAHDKNVYILDMQPGRYRTTKSAAKQFRKPYQTTKDVCVSNRSHCACDFFETIYAIDADRNSGLSPALLCTSKEIRREAHSIFYQENTFFFDSMTAVMPFLRDRTLESRATVKSIGFHLALDHYIKRNPIYLNWVCVFREVSRMAGLRLQHLSLRIESPRHRLSSVELWATGDLDWVYSITRISGLKGLHIEFDLGSPLHYSPEMRERVLEAERANANWLWCWLAPQMLADRKGTVDKAVAYLQSDEAARLPNCLFILDGVKGGEMTWDVRHAMRYGGRKQAAC